MVSSPVTRRRSKNCSPDGLGGGYWRSEENKKRSPGCKVQLADWNASAAAQTSLRYVSRITK